MLCGPFETSAHALWRRLSAESEAALSADSMPERFCASQIDAEAAPTHILFRHEGESQLVLERDERRKRGRVDARVERVDQEAQLALLDVEDPDRRLDAAAKDDEGRRAHVGARVERVEAARALDRDVQVELEELELEDRAVEADEGRLGRLERERGCSRGKRKTSARSSG